MRSAYPTRLILMQDETTETRDWGEIERSALYALTEDENPPVMSIADLGREIEYFDAEAVVRPLVNAGLLHRITGDRMTGDLVVATPAAYKWVAMVGHVD